MSYSYNYLQNEKQKAKGLFVAELLNTGRIWLVLSELAVLPARKTACGFLLSISLGADAPWFPNPRYWGRVRPRWERLPIREGSRTQRASSAPASAAFAAVLTTSPYAPEGTVLEGEVLQGRLRRQAPWHTQGREFAAVPGGCEPFPGYVQGWEGERAGKTLAHLSPWYPGPPWTVLQGCVSCHHLEISGSERLQSAPLGILPNPPTLQGGCSACWPPVCGQG